MAKLEEISSFFGDRAETYDKHMLDELGLREFYDEIGRCVPSGNIYAQILDLGCGTGLELEQIFRILPESRITCVDISPEMIEKLNRKYPAKKGRIKTICASYFDVDYGQDTYDIALSTYSLHHFTPQMKGALYGKIHAALKSGGTYIEGDYVVRTLGEEMHFFKENERIRKEQGITVIRHPK